mgnify:CR=1 FL=1
MKKEEWLELVKLTYKKMKKKKKTYADAVQEASKIWQKQKHKAEQHMMRVIRKPRTLHIPLPRLSVCI